LEALFLGVVVFLATVFLVFFGVAFFFISFFVSFFFVSFFFVSFFVSFFFVSFFVSFFFGGLFNFGGLLNGLLGGLFIAFFFFLCSPGNTTLSNPVVPSTVMFLLKLMFPFVPRFAFAVGVNPPCDGVPVASV